MSQRKEFWTYSKSRSVRISRQIEPKMGENEDPGMTVLLLAWAIRKSGEADIFWEGKDVERAALEEEVRKSVWRTSVKYQTGDESQGVDARSRCGCGSSWRYRLEESPAWMRYLKQWAGWGLQGHTYEDRTEEVAPWSWQSPCISRDPRFGEGPEKVTEKEYQQRGRKSGRVDYSGGQENSIYRKEDAYHPTREEWKGRSWNVWLYHRG